jgi:hypothetical protein
MTKIVTTIDGIHGDVKIVIEDNDEVRKFELRWCEFDEDGSTGFIASFSETPILLTELAAEHFLRIVISNLIRTLSIKPGNLIIINNIGEHIPDVQFLPPTFEGNDLDIVMFTAQQAGLAKLYTMYEEIGILNSEIVDMAESEGVMDDFLSLVQVRASNSFSVVSKPSQ